MKIDKDEESSFTSSDIIKQKGSYQRKTKKRLKIEVKTNKAREQISNHKMHFYSCGVTLLLIFFLYLKLSNKNFIGKHIVLGEKVKIKKLIQVKSKACLQNL